MDLDVARCKWFCECKCHKCKSVADPADHTVSVNLKLNWSFPAVL